VDTLGLTTTKEHTEVITKIVFPVTAAYLERYLGIANWLQDKIPRYVQITEPLQLRKTVLLKTVPAKGKPYKSFTQRAAFAYPTGAERVAFNTL
jgi:hypothetical protein